MGGDWAASSITAKGLNQEIGSSTVPHPKNLTRVTAEGKGVDSRGEWSPWLPLETRPDSPGEPGMQPRDPCLPWRGKLGPGHTLR